MEPVRQRPDDDVNVVAFQGFPIVGNEIDAGMQAAPASGGIFPGLGDHPDFRAGRLFHNVDVPAADAPVPSTATP